MYVQGITEVEIKTAKEAKNLILMGLKSRHVAATEMNAESSRSHLLFSIFLTTSFINSKGSAVEKTSRLHLIDLAGSERQKKTKAQGERIKEACMINKSLSTLGNVINALVENYEGKNKYIPFRDSKLTYFLKDSLGGNSKTTIVANISTSLIQMNETISTLKFVQRAKMIKNSATLNMSVQENIEYYFILFYSLYFINKSYFLTMLNIIYIVLNIKEKIKEKKLLYLSWYISIILAIILFFV